MTPAQALMLIVPEGTQMDIEAWVANKDIDFVYEGQIAEVRVEAFNFQKYGTLDGKLVEISSDAIEDKEKGWYIGQLCADKIRLFCTDE